jgi:CHAT domain-containing protein
VFDFILSFVKNGTDYLLCAESPFLAGQAPPLPFQRSEVFLQRESPSAPRRDVSSGPARVAHPSDSVQIGRTLYRRVFSGEVEALFLRALALAREERTGLRILIRSWHEPEIHNLPWELLHDGRRFLAQSIETPVVRSLEQPRPVREFRIDPPLRLLLTTSCPAQGSPLDIQGEEQRLRAAVSPLEDRAILVTEHQVSLERLRFLLFRARAQGRPFKVWHHAGHGHCDADGFSLVLTNSNGSAQRVTVAEIEAILEPCEEVRLAVLNACSSATAAGLATALANLNVPAVIGFRESILDRSALVFAEELYKGLVETTLERAVSRARLELRDAGYSAIDWSYPLLFARTTAAGPWL